MHGNGYPAPPAPEELDVVRFTEPIGGWPAGTMGTLVHTFDGEGIAEVSDDEGRTIDLVTVPYESITVTSSAQRQPVV